MPHNGKEWHGKQVAGRWDGVSEVDLSIPPIVAAKMLLFMENSDLAGLLAEFPLAYAGVGELRECIDHLLTGHKVREQAVEATIEPMLAPIATDLPERVPGEAIHKNPPSPRISRILEQQVTDQIVHDMAQLPNYHTGASDPREFPIVIPQRQRIGRNPMPNAQGHPEEFRHGQVGY